MIRRVWAVVRLEPVRVWAYGAIVPAFGVLVVYGVLSDAEAVAWISAAAGALGVRGAEAVRSKVSPTITRPPEVDPLEAIDPLGPKH